MLIVAYLMSHPNSVYRTRQDAPEEDELLPGMDVRRLNVPASWAGQTLDDLVLQKRFGVQVIGLYRRASGGEVQVQQEVDPSTVLEEGDILAITGSDQSLDALSEFVVDG